MELVHFVLLKVGVAGFEPTTSTSQMWRDTGLRYTPISIDLFYYFNFKIKLILILVGVAGFEPTTSTSQMWRDTGLRYTPIGIFILLFKGVQSNGFKTVKKSRFLILFCGEGGIRTRGTVTSTTV